MSIYLYFLNKTATTKSMDLSIPSLLTQVYLTPKLLLITYM